MANALAPLGGSSKPEHNMMGMECCYKTVNAENRRELLKFS